jgi:aminoglycoside phosphotransferase (APT) family kinase protein
MHADEVETDVALVRRLVVAQFPQWAELPIEPVHPGGTVHAIYRLGDEMAVRLPRRWTDDEEPDKEFRWLPRLAPLLPLAIPVPLARGEPGEGYPFDWSIYSWLDGDPATEAPVGDLGRATSNLAEFVGALHRFDAQDGPVPGRHNSWRGVPLAMRDASVRSSIEALRDEIDLDAVTAVWQEALRAPDWEGRPTWFHGDLDARNMLVAEGRLCAVIDWGCLGVGDPACDVMVAWKIPTAATRPLFRDALSVDDATWVRARGWALSQALIALSTTRWRRTRCSSWKRGAGWPRCSPIAVERYALGGDQMYGVVVVTGTKPSRSRIGLQLSEASVSR